MNRAIVLLLLLSLVLVNVVFTDVVQDVETAVEVMKEVGTVVEEVKEATETAKVVVETVTQVVDIIENTVDKVEENLKPNHADSVPISTGTPPPVVEAEKPAADAEKSAAVDKPVADNVDKPSTEKPSAENAETPASAEKSSTGSAAAAATDAKKKKKDWSQKRISEVEKQWESGDAPEELEEEHEHIRKIASQKNQINFDDPKAVREALKKNRFGMTAGSGSKMVFVSLKSPQPNGQPWNKKSVDKIARRWTELLRTANLDGQFYNIEDTGKLLVNISKSWVMDDIMKFILGNPETDYVEIDNKKYTAKDVGLNDDDDDDEEVVVKKPKKKSKAKAKKSTKSTKKSEL